MPNGYGIEVDEDSEIELNSKGKQKRITLSVMRGTPVIELLADKALIYGEEVRDNGRLYREMLEWCEWWKTERSYEPLAQAISSPRQPRYFTSRPSYLNEASISVTGYNRGEPVEAINTGYQYDEATISEPLTFTTDEAQTLTVADLQGLTTRTRFGGNSNA